MSKPNNPGNEGAPPGAVHHVHMDRDKRSYWQRAHHDWRFWVGMFLMLAALAIYVMSDDLSRLSPFRSQPISSGPASQNRKSTLYETHRQRTEGCLVFFPESDHGVGNEQQEDGHLIKYSYLTVVL